MPSGLNTSSPDSSGLDKLRKGIEDLRRKAVDRHYFNPQSIKELCTPELVKAAIRDCSFPAHKKDGIAQSIIRNGVLIFCILVHIEKEHLVVTILERDVLKQLDSRLPMDISALDFMQREESRRFFEVQWEFIPVKLPKCEYLQIDELYILPYWENKRHGDRGGSFGDIYTITVEWSMQDMLECSEPKEESGVVKMIRKQIRFNENIEGFARERKCLETLQQLQHPNIVELLCSYTYKGEHSLIFPCEDMDLNDFFKMDERYRDFQSNHTFFVAMYGLVSAVEYLHSFRSDGKEDFSTLIGYHHDIRPHNILVRSDTFVLADFGLANLNEEGRSSTSKKGGAGEYMAPECLKGGHIGRAADIWSLGGVFLDIAAYIEEGPKGRTKAQDEREGGGPYVDAMTTHFFTNGELKKGVLDTIGRLQHNPKDKTLRTLLLLSRDMLNVKEESRSNAHTSRRNAAYIAIKSLFRGALEGMIRWRERAKEMDAGRIWEDTWKLWAWGEEVGINGVNLATEKFKDAVPQGDINEKKLQRILLKLVQTLEGEKLLQENCSARRGSDRAPAPGQYYGVEAQKINDSIRNLRTALPDDYGKRIKTHKAFYGRYAEHDPPKLPDMPAELLQSPAKLVLTDPPEDQKPKDDLAQKKTETRISKDTGNSFDKSYRPALRLDMSQADRNSRRSQSMSSRDLESPYLTRTSSPPSWSPVIHHSKEKQMTTPKSKIESGTSKPRSSTFSPNHSSGKSTDATSIEPENPVNVGSKPVSKAKALPRRPPPYLSLPEPVICSSWPKHGSILEGTGIAAQVTYETATSKRETERFDTHVLRNEDAGKESIAIYCISDSSNMSLCHCLNESASAYPHTDYVIDDKASISKVHFLGNQVLYEETALREPSPEPTDDEHLLIPRMTRIESTNVTYTFASPKDCKTFRSLVWGKDLLECLGASEILWPSVKEAASVTISLWREHSAARKLSVTFRARLKGAEERALVLLALANVDPVGRQEDKNLYLYIEAPGEPSKSAKSKKSVRYQELKIKFPSQKDCNAACLRINKVLPGLRLRIQD